MIISYAQNFEDVMLWRALKHVEAGFYIDVGANDPSVDSVTRLFYEQGWHGINIEPLNSHVAALQRDRPRDINLCTAVGASVGEVDIWECDVRGWATADREVVDQHIRQGRQGRYVRTPMTTLSAVCLEHAADEIHFLKVDVEGFEAAVLQGMDFRRFRPWIVVVEATRPHSTEEVHEAWEPWLLQSDYALAYADGLNRFYLAGEHVELGPHFKYPPNFFDEFVKAPDIESSIWAQTIMARANEADERAGHANARTGSAELRALNAEERATHSQARLGKAEDRVTRAEERATRAEERATYAEARSTYAEARASAAEQALSLAQARLEQAHAKVMGQEEALAQARAQALRQEETLAQAHAKALRQDEALAQAHAWALKQEDALTQGQQRAGQIDAQLAASRADAAHLSAALAQSELRVNSLMGSTSWRVTAPLRALTSRLRGSVPAEPGPAALPVTAPMSVPEPPRIDTESPRVRAIHDQLNAAVQAQQRGRR
jgi:FkbM family methyltransferase